MTCRQFTSQGFREVDTTSIISFSAPLRTSGFLPRRARKGSVGWCRAARDRGEAHRNGHGSLSPESGPGRPGRIVRVLLHDPNAMVRTGCPSSAPTHRLGRRSIPGAIPKVVSPIPAKARAFPLSDSLLALDP